MSSQNFIRRFVKEVYGGDYKAYHKALKEDYLKVQLEWSCFIDSLCKNREITQWQYDKATFPAKK